jgi:hypothetical protein
MAGTMKHALAIAVSCACLAACAQKPPLQVSIPVATPCLAPDAVPVQPAPLDDMPADANAALSVALDKLLEWRLFGIEADGKLKACAGLR